MNVDDVIKQYYLKENYVYIVVKTKNSYTSGFYLIDIENSKAEYSNLTIQIFESLGKYISSSLVKNGITIFKYGTIDYIQYYNPELFIHDLMDLVLFQKYSLMPIEQERKNILQESIKKEKIKETLVYACYSDNREKIIEKGKIAKSSELEKKLQYSGTPLGFCAEHNFLEGFKLLANKGANVSKKSLAKTPIELAFEYSDEIVYYLYENHHEEFIESVNKKGFKLGINNRNENILQLLLKSGADLIGKDPYFPNLHNFVDAENTIGLKFLLEQGFDINIKNMHKETALERAIRTGKKQSIELLESYIK